MSFSIVILSEAERDLDQILGWLHVRSPEGAATWYRRWLEILTSLEEHADACELAPEGEGVDGEIRHRNFKTGRGRPYRILFTIRQRKVYILHLRGPGQNLVDPRHMRFPPN